MRANEFIKEFGVNYTVNYADYAVNINDLKRLVESHEIITLFKCIDQARIEVEACEKSNHLELLVKLDEGVGYIYTSRVKQAILDMESCQ